MSNQEELVNLDEIEEKLDTAVRKLSSKYVLDFVCKWRNRDEQTLRFTRQILGVEVDKAYGFILANLLTRTIVKSNPYRGTNAKDLRKALLCAKAFSTHYYNKEHNFRHSLHKWRGKIRAYHPQIYTQEKASLEPAVLYYWFHYLAEKSSFKKQFDLNQNFKEAMGFEIETFLFVVIGCWFASLLDEELKGRPFTLNYLLVSNKAGINIPSEKEITKAIDLLVCTPAKLRELEKKRKEKPVKFRNYDLNYLRTYPLIKLDSRTSQIVVPFPDLLISQAINLIYFELGKRFCNDFNQWFGEVFESFCKESFKKSIKSTDELKKFSEEYGEKEENPDFFIISEETAIIIEVKTARIRRGVLISNEKKELCITLQHIEKALRQLIKGKQQFIARKNQFEVIKEFIGLIITFDDYHDIHQNVYDLSQKMISGVSSEIDMLWITLDYKKLLKLQPYLKHSSLTLSDVLKMIHESDADSVIKKIQKQYPLNEIQQSFLASYLEELIDNFLK